MDIICPFLTICFQISASSSRQADMSEPFGLSSDIAQCPAAAGRHIRQLRCFLHHLVPSSRSDLHIYAISLLLAKPLSKRTTLRHLLHHIWMLNGSHLRTLEHPNRPPATLKPTSPRSRVSLHLVAQVLRHITHLMIFATLPRSRVSLHLVAQERRIPIATSFSHTSTFTPVAMSCLRIQSPLQHTVKYSRFSPLSAICHGHHLPFPYNLLSNKRF